MSNIVVIHQPDFLPWLGFFHRFLHADLYIALDHAQFVSGTSRSWTHRDRIKTPHGARWLSLSVQKAPVGTPINQMRLTPNRAWREACLNLIRENYRRAPALAEVMPHLETLFRRSDEYLVDMTLASIDLLAGLLDRSLPRRLSSKLDPTGTKNEMLVDLLRKVGATHYLSGVGARAYLDPTLYAKAGIEVVWQDFAHPVYPQLHGPFVPALSAIDMLFNCGIDQTRKILRSCK